MKAFFAFVHRYERHLSAAAMLGGFILDNIFFTRIDLVLTHTVFLGYLAIAACSIGLLHYLEERAAGGARRARWHSLLPIATQFAFGGLWSGLLIFFSRSGAVATSWPFLLILGAIFLGNEIFKKYHSLLVFNAVLYFFALYAYTILAIPILTRDIGTGSFLLSGVAAVAAFAVLMLALRFLGRSRFLKSVWPIRFWVGVLFILINLAYVTNILPPLPLALKSAGIYHEVTRTAAGFSGAEEEQPWYGVLGLDPVVHTTSREPLYAYSAVFAPIRLQTKVVHRWERYDEVGGWVTESVIPFSIVGGRDGGYRVYSIKKDLAPGSWRVDIETENGRLIGRIGFVVERVQKKAETTMLPLE
jgi:hypothetical protein